MKILLLFLLFGKMIIVIDINHSSLCERVVNHFVVRTSNESILTIRMFNKQSISTIGFFVYKKSINLKERRLIVISIIKQELEMEETLKKKIEFICEFSNTTPTIINGSIRKVEKTNLSYIEPYKIIIKEQLFLAFNYSNDIYIGNLSNKIKITELESVIKGI